MQAPLPSPPSPAPVDARPQVGRRAEARRAERAAVGTLLGVLLGAGEQPVVHAAALNPHPGESVAAHASVAAAAALLAIPAPWSGLALLVACGLSAWVETRGGRGWVGRLLPRQVGHNVLLWGLRPLRGSDRPCLVVAAPHDGGLARIPRYGRAAPLMAAPGVLAGAGLAAAPLAREVAVPLLTWSALGFGVVALGGVLHRLTHPARVEPGPAGRALLGLAAALRAHPLAHLDVVLAFLAGGAAANDSLEILLRNHRVRLPADRTRVLVLQPDPGTPAFAAEEGRIQPMGADPLLARAASTAGLPMTSACTPAARAGIAGWRAGALLTPSEAVVAPTLQIIAALDADAGEGRW